MESSLLPWHWIVEHLASIPEAETSVLCAIVDRFPSVLGDSSNDVRERLALRCLEECTDMVCGETPPAVATNSTPGSASAAKIDASQSCEEVLRSKVATANNHDQGNEDLDDVDVHKFILQKRAALKKSSIELLKEKILGSYHPDFSCSKAFNNLPKVPRYWHVSNANRDDLESKKIIENMKYASPCMGKLTLIRKYRKLKNLANTPLKSVGGASPKDTSCLQHLADQNTPDDNDRYHHQTNLDDTCTGFQMEKANANPGKGSFEFHDVEILSPKDNLLDYASDPISAPENFKESQSEQRSQEHTVLHRDVSKLQEVGDSDSDSDDLQLLEQCSMPQPSSALCLCIKCGSNGQLLKCCGEGCSRAIHESCLGILATGEKTSDPFFCLFCSYRNARRMFEKSKRKAAEAQRNLFSFYNIDPAVRALKRKRSSANQVCIQNGSEHPDFHSNHQFESNPDEQKHGETSDGRFPGDINQENTQDEQIQLNVAADRICENILPCKETTECCTYQDVPDTPIELKSKTGRVHESPSVSEDQQPANDPGVSGYNSLSSELNTSHERNDDACVNNVMSEVSRDHTQAEKENLHTFEADEEQLPLQPNKKPVLKVEGGCDHGAKRKALASKISDRFGRRSRRKRATRTDNCHGVIGNKKTENPTSRELKKSPYRQNHCSAIKKLTSRRPMLIWKPEEEEVLEEALQKIPQNDDGTIPWIKILEYGRHVLHESRTPIDLKDKWRNMQKREAKNRC